MRKHKHHIIPKHAGGTDDPSNIIEVTIEEHARLHKELFEQYGRWQDQVAYRMLSGQIAPYEATIEAIKKAQTGRKHSPEHNAAKSRYSKNRKWSEETKRKISNSNIGKHNMSDEHKEKISNVHKGKKLTDEHKEIMRQTHKNKPKTEEQKRKMAAAAKLVWAKRRLEKGELVSR